MRLKVSVKEALKVIDGLVQKGYRVTRNPQYKSTLDKDEQVQKWFMKAGKALKEVFLDTIPVYRILKCRKPSDRSSVYMPIYMTVKDKKEELDIQQELEVALDVLIGYYEYFVSQEKSPVKYLADKAEIWLYDLCCSLEPESNESELCRYMFNFGIGEWVEIAEIHKIVVGQEYDPKAVNKNVVVNALDGVNRKTKDAFDFPLLKKKKSVVALAIPSRFVLEQ